MVNPKYEKYFIFNNKQYVLFEEYKKVKYARCSVDTFPSNFDLKENIVKELSNLIKEYIPYIKKHTCYGIGKTYLSVPDILIPHYEKLKIKFLEIIKNPDNYEDIDIKRN